MIKTIFLAILLALSPVVYSKAMEPVENPVFLAVVECSNVVAFVYYDDENYVTVPAGSIQSEEKLSFVVKLRDYAEENGRTGVINTKNKDKCPEI